MDKVGEVYGLYCVCPTCVESRPREIRYVGVTVEGLPHRLRAHINESSGNSQKAKDRWIRKHGPENIRGKVLESGILDLEDLRVAEISWIAKLGTFGGGLNMTRGGEGVWGYRFSDEVRARFRERTREQMAVKHPRAKLNESDVREIIQRIWAGETAGTISQDYPVSASTIQRIRSGKNWPDVPRPGGVPPQPTPTGGHPRVSPELRDQIKAEHRGTWGELKRLSQKFGVSETTISLIINGHRD